VFDTWVLNEDRFFTRPDGTSRRNSNNVFLSEEAPTGKLLLRAMDHSHCFTNGREIIPKRLGVDRVQDTTVYGLFPEFGSFLDKSIVKKAVKDLRRMDRAIAESLIDTIPREWDVSANGRLALADFICRRAAYLAEKVSRAARWEPRIMTLLWPQGELFP
jgi:hypothetical protein